MKLSKFLSIIFSVTTFSLLYVYQQTEIFRLAYVGQKNQTVFQELLDKNSILRYNIKTNGSLARIGNKISGNADFQMPDSYVLVRMPASGTALNLAKESTGQETILSRLFGIKRQAEAKTLNP
jgi:hypothetical protein